MRMKVIPTAMKRVYVPKVPMQWKDSERTLTIGLREGSYPGMPEQIKMRVKLYLPEGAALESKECASTQAEK